METKTSSRTTTSTIQITTRQEYMQELSNVSMTDEEFQQLYKDSIVDVSYNPIGLKGPVVDEILSTVKDAEKESNTQQPNGNNNSSRSLLARPNQDLLAVDLFNVAEALVVQHLYQLY